VCSSLKRHFIISSLSGREKSKFGGKHKKNSEPKKTKLPSKNLNSEVSKKNSEAKNKIELVHCPEKNLNSEQKKLQTQKNSNTMPFLLPTTTLSFPSSPQCLPRFPHPQWTLWLFLLPPKVLLAQEEQLKNKN
jgi:hypothetical protein